MGISADVNFSTKKRILLQTNWLQKQKELVELIFLCNVNLILSVSTIKCSNWNVKSPYLWLNWLVKVQTVQIDLTH